MLGHWVQLPLKLVANILRSVESCFGMLRRRMPMVDMTQQSKPPFKILQADARLFLRLFLRLRQRERQLPAPRLRAKRLPLLARLGIARVRQPG